MALSIKIIGVLVLIAIVSVSGILIFMKGFLLSKTSIENISACKPDFALGPEDDHPHHGVEGCWMHGRFKRAIILMIDALRFDFLAYNSSLNEPSFFQNKIKSVNRLLVSKPKNSRIYKFIADPPTTTMQRLKGLTTGSLPTFVDAGSNFNSYEIAEDNLINQMIEAERRIKFFGDDTWLSLYPKKFYKSFGFPSFDVKDLHSVDNGVLKVLYPEMRRHDWDLIIAHFLGVDHCGHRYGPNHSAMADKLTQMDDVIRNVTELMSDDTILFVMGDHGMTRTGDHGGDSDNELTAGLFIYSPALLASYPQEKVDDIPQTDFVPTISLLLGLPIPFSNVGKIIPELFSHCSWWGTDTNAIRRKYHTVEALRLNAHQIDAYLAAYQDISSDLPRGDLYELKQRLTDVEAELTRLVTKIFVESLSGNAVDEFSVVEKMYLSYLRDARQICESVWAKFDLKMISLGLMTMITGLFLTLYFFLLPDEESEEFPKSVGFVVGGTVLHLAYLAFHLTFLPKTVPPVMAFVISGVLIFLIFIIIKDKFMEYIFHSVCISDLASYVITIMTCLVYFSNSFVVYEDIISLFFLQTIVLSIWFSFINESKDRLPEKAEQLRSIKKSKTNQDSSQSVISPVLATLILTLSCMALLQASSNFTACREEQHACEDSFFLKPLSGIDNASKNQRYIFSFACLAVMIYAVRLWLKYYGNLNGTSLGVICMTYAPWTAIIFTSLHWALQALPQSMLETVPQWQQVIMAQIVYGIIIVSLITLLASPVLVFTQAKQNSAFSMSLMGNKAHVIPTIYNQLKVQLSGAEEDKPPMVYGLGSVYSASIVALTCLISLLLCLLLNDGASPSVMIALLTFYIALELYSASQASRKRHNRGKDNLERVSWSGVALVSLFSTVFFYSTGHQPTIPSIRMEAAYTGFYGNFNTLVLPGFLIWTNTFASHIFFALVSPLLIFWPALSSALVQWMLRIKGNKQEQSTWQGDFQLFGDGIKLRKRLLHLFCGIIIFINLKVLSAALAATVHRRHLMVWKIFAPRFIYEAAMFATTLVTMLLSYLFVLRVDSALSRFVKTLPNANEKEN